MKKIYNTLFLVLFFNHSSDAQIKVLPSGDFAIGQNYITNGDFKVEINGERKAALALTTRHETPYGWASISDAISPLTKHWIVSHNGYRSSHNFWVYSNGEANAISYRTWSDSSFKQNIRPIGNANHIISLLEPHIYDYKPGFNGGGYYDSLIYTNQPGFIAQELQEVLPNLVNPIDESGKLGVNYQGIIPIVVQCLKEQNNKIQQLENALAQCCLNGEAKTNQDQDGHSYKMANSNKEASAISDHTSFTPSFTIIPNPNKGNFEISFNSPNPKIKPENILITTLAGELVNSIAISQLADKIHVDMNGSRSGIYYVNIIYEGNVLSTKKVVIYN